MLCLFYMNISSQLSDNKPTSTLGIHRNKFTDCYIICFSEFILLVVGKLTLDFHFKQDRPVSP